MPESAPVVLEVRGLIKRLLAMLQYSPQRIGDLTMLAKKIDVDKTSLKELLALVREGAEVLLTEGDTPVARLTPVEAQTGKRVPNLHPGGWMSDDFDDPLPDEFWLGEA